MVKRYHAVVVWWRQVYNTERPHRALQFRILAVGSRESLGFGVRYRGGAHEKERFVLSVSDNGVGVPGNFDFDHGTFCRLKPLIQPV